MSTLLHISASPRGAASASLALADAFLDQFSATAPTVTVEHWDLWDGSLPEFGPDAAAAKMAVFAGERPSGAAELAWARAAAAFERFAAADHYLFSVPMWNAGVPYILKQFIDVVSQPGMVFGFDAVTGYQGLLAGSQAAVVVTSAVYGEGRGPAFGNDFQLPYLADWLRWAGIEHSVTVEQRPNLAVEDAAGRRSRSLADAAAAGRAFGRSVASDRTMSPERRTA